MYFEFDNDDMESSKRRSIFISLIFIQKCLNLIKLQLFSIVLPIRKDACAWVLFFRAKTAAN